MSKKKAFSGSTMTLKDFHGGSIPSDLPLPSAPGIIARPSDRSGFDRQMPTTWGNHMGRSDHRSRPGSSGTTRNFDEKASFLSHPAHIGRNFDEDERKPLDGVSAPRRTVSGETVRALPSRPELKQDSVSAGRFSDRQVSSPVSHSPSATANSYPARFTGTTPVGVNSQTSSGNNGQAVTGSYPNAWGTRKEMGGVSDPMPTSAWSGPNAVSRFAQASALEKVSSGRWQSKHLVHNQPDVEVIRFSETESEFRSEDNYTYNGMDLVNEGGNYDVMRVSHAESGWIAQDGIRGDGKGLPDYERAKSPMYSEAKEGNRPFYPGGVWPTSTEGKYGGPELQPLVPSEVSERPKLKLIPRSKPLETLEPPVTDYKQGYQQATDSAHVEVVNEFYGNSNLPKPGSAGSEGGNRAVERPKLNLKPRSQPIEKLQGSAENERKTLFGGARPRELVLRERGTEDVAINNLDLSQPPNRVKHELPKTETVTVLESAVPTARYSGRAENLPLGQRIGRDTTKKDHRPDTEKADVQKRNWRTENWKNGRETGKQQQQQPEPETWRKPVEQPKPAAPEAPGLRYGKATSALELAQAFSRSISDPKTADHPSGPRGLPGRNQIPFSRLTDTREFYSGPNSRRQINGY